MTVKELIEVLQGCNEQAKVFVSDSSGTSELQDNQIFQNLNTTDEAGSEVVFDITEL